MLFCAKKKYFNQLGDNSLSYVFCLCALWEHAETLPGMKSSYNFHACVIVKYFLNSSDNENNFAWC